MELETARSAWQGEGERLEAGLRLSERLVRAVTSDRVETALRRLSRLLWVELAMNLLAVSLLGYFIGANLAAPRYFVPALFLDLGAIALVAVAVRQLVALRSVDPAQPVAGVQARLAALKVERVRAGTATLIAAPLAWVPLLIVSLRAVFGIDTYSVFSGAWLVANVIFGLSVIAVAVWAARRWPGRIERAPWLRSLSDHLAGRSLASAVAELRAIESFSRR